MLHYTVSYQYPNRQYIDIRFEVPALQQQTTYLYLPAWRPGRYQIANFAKYIQQFQPKDADGNLLSYQKVSSHCWAVATKGVSHLTVDYNYYAAQLDAGNTYLDEDQLYINPVNCAIYEGNRIAEPCRIQLKVPSDYKVATALERTGKNTFTAHDFHHLADSPLIASDSLKDTTLEVDGYRFHFWFLGEANPDHEQLKADFTGFIRKAIEPFGELPVQTYHFFYQLPAYPLVHGVEHQESTVIAIGPGYNLMNPDMYRMFLGISAHELYHTWNIKQIRPAEMTPYRYQEANYSRLGYVAEGVTTYFGDLILLRGGVFSFESYQEQFNKLLTRHLQNYGRFNRSVAASSFDTWLDGYEAGAPARKTSIYIKGALVSFLLDVELMRLTENELSLNDVMARLYHDFARKGYGYTEQDFKQVIEQLSGCSFDHFFAAYVQGVTPLEEPLARALDYLGMKLTQNQSGRNWEKHFGIKVQESHSRPKVTQVAPDSPAERSGLSAEDELIAINGLKIDHNLANLFAYYHTDTIELTIFRNNKLKHLHLATDGHTYFQDGVLELLAEPTEQQRENFRQWSHQPYPIPEADPKPPVASSGD